MPMAGLCCQAIGKGLGADVGGIVQGGLGAKPVATLGISQKEASSEGAQKAIKDFAAKIK